MILLRKLRYPLIVVAILGLAIWLAVMNNLLIERLRSEGRPYNVGVATVTPKDGINGKSAYDLAVENGFKGTEQQWLLSLIGSSGTGQPGEPGLSAYQIAVLTGFTGSQSDWIASLHGKDGKDGATGATGAIGPTGAPGVNGAAGTNGVDGQPGKDGTNGTNGQTPELRCNQSNNMVQWKYTDEPDTAWRDLYQPTGTCAVSPATSTAASKH